MEVTSRLAPRANRGVPRSRFDDEQVSSSTAAAAAAASILSGRARPAQQLQPPNRRRLAVSSSAHVRAPTSHRANPQAAARAAVTSPAEPSSQSTQEALSDSEPSPADHIALTTTGRTRRAPSIFDNSDTLRPVSRRDERERNSARNEVRGGQMRELRYQEGASQRDSRLAQARARRQAVRQSIEQRQIDAGSLRSARRQSAIHDSGRHEDAFERAQQDRQNFESDDVIFDRHDKNQDCAQIFFCDSSGFNIRHDNADQRMWRPVPDVDKLRSFNTFADVMSPTAPITVCASCGRKDIDTSGGVHVPLSDLELLQTINTERLERYWALPTEYRHYMTITFIGNKLYDVHLKFLDLSTEDTQVPLCSDCFRDVKRGRRPQFNVGNGYDFGNIDDLEPLTAAESAATATCIRFQSVVKFRGTDAQGQLTG